MKNIAKDYNEAHYVKLFLKYFVNKRNSVWGNMVMMMSPFNGGLVFWMMPVFVGLIFVFVICIFIFAAVRGVRQWRHNNAQPVLTVDAVVVSKRMEVSHHHHDAGAHVEHMHTSTTYFATFQVSSGDRMEFLVGGREYGFLAEGDCGQLTFQGTRYMGFQRT